MAINRKLLGSIDLSLLSTFQVLLAERNATKTAQKLGLTQSTVSKQISKLEKLTGLELILRQANGLQPTASALELGEAVHTALGVLFEVFEQQEYNYQSDAVKIKIAATDYFSSFIYPHFIDYLESIEAAIQIEIIPIPCRLDTEIFSANDLRRLLVGGAVDLMIYHDNIAFQNSKSQQLLSDPWFLVGGEYSDLNIDTMVQKTDLKYISAGPLPADLIRAMGPEYQNFSYTGYYNSIFDTVTKSNVVGIGPSKAFDFNNPTIASRALEIKNIHPFQLSQYWNPQRTEERSLKFVRSLIWNYCSEL